ncbi:glucose 1-dehydrogenase [Paenibacillus beijingensis]|uniref:3-ketoacyl-ACP reductase n=1 Tax=Paenibacillus beijingensis TaxID=1126833 RepID=A0A0D5NPC6_9BACL|nr:glucose 1-dehydrogenase [Paenibacillus beijingensis]AJY76768.1 3-ketoacyl-ACP reductase [Paenibacillus beijingensis]
MRLQEKVAVITGAGSGIGRSTSVLFAQQGAKVAVADVNSQAAEETVGIIREAGGEAVPVRVDVSKEDSVKEMFNTAVQHFGKLDIVFNNAGVPMTPHPIEEITEELYDRIFNVNVKGVIFGCKHAVPFFKKQGYGGVIINTASTVASSPKPGLNVYAASKNAVITLTKSFALDLADSQIRVVGISPAAVDSPMFAGFIGDRDEAEAKKSYISTIPLGRLVQPDDIANAALYLASDEASLVTGIVLNVCGGRSV